MSTTTARRARRALLAGCLAVAGLAGATSVDGTAGASIGSFPVLTTPKATLVVGERATFTVALAKLPGAPKATGTVAFSLDGAPAFHEAELVSGKAAVATRAVPVGEHEVVVHYEGDASYAGSDSNVLSVIVARGETATTLGVRSEVVASGRAALISSLAKRVAPGSGGTLAGSTTFTAVPEVGAPVQATVPAGATGSSQWRPKLPDGTWTLTAAYGGNGDWVGSSSGFRTIVVGDEPVVDQDNLRDLEPDIAFGVAPVGNDGTESLSVVQTFATRYAGRLTSVDLDLAPVDDPGDLVVTIRALDADRRPTGPVLATAIANASAVSVNLPLDVEVPVLANQSYALEARVLAPGPGVWEVGFAVWENDPDLGSYIGGRLTAILPGGDEVLIPAADLRFRTYVRRT